MNSYKSNYLQACKDRNVVPNDGVIRIIKESNKLNYLENGEPFLNFSGCNLSVSDCQLLSKCFATDDLVQRYLFTDCLLSEDACKVTLNAFMFNKSLTVLDLKGNNLRNSGAHLVGKLLKRTMSLTELYLEWNTLGMWDDGITAIAEGLALNQSLQVLDLSNNQISHEGGQEIASSLKQNRVLRTLDMRWNNIGVIGGRAFLSSLNHNKYLVNLALAGNNIPSDTLKAIATAMQRNVDYHSIYEEHQSMTRSLKQEIDHLQHEKSLQKKKTMPNNNINEQAVQETNDMSILSKASMSNSGYFYDPYLKLFASKVVQRAPLIHRGYFIRAKAIDYTLKSFLENHENYEKVQIVSLGAGFDSSYFRLKDQGLLDKCDFIEVDFPDVVKRKQNIIKKQSSLLNLIGDYKIINGCLTSLNYKIIPCDLTKFQDLEAFFIELNIDTSAPTLFFSEVVLAYIDYDKAVELLLWMKRKFENCITAVFEQIQPYDAFGQVMVKHFKKLNSPLQRVHKLLTVQDHIELLQSLNYDVVVGFDMNFFFDQYLNIGDKVDMFVLEAFDEFEEWSLMCSHYCLTVAFQGVCGDVVSAMFPYKVRLRVNITEVNNFEVFTKNLDQIPLMRYGHACSKIAPNQYLASGGFGVTQDFSHDKLSSGFILTFPDNTSKITSDSHVTVDTIDIGFKHMYHTLTYVSDGLLFIFGGRASPSRPCNTYGFYKLKDSVMTPENVYTNDGGDEQPCNRWRHAAAKFQNKIYIFGGRSNTEAALNDIWSFDLDSKKWKLENTSQVILPCFSPSMDVWDDSLLIYGGIAAHLVTFKSLYLLKVKEDVIDTKEMRFKVALPTRYSHSTHVIDDQLFVIGGIDPNCTSQPPILIISLKEKTWRAVALPQCNPSRPLMLHNHCSLMRSKGEIVVVGGGGNCFSFGTHLNQDLAVLDLFAFTEL